MEINFEDFQKLDLRIGEIKEAGQLAGSRNLIKMMVNFGEEKKQCIAGLLNWYSPDELIGKKFVFLTNLKPRKLMGVESQCMILAAENKEGKVVCLQPEKDISVGSKIH